jgi:hypothetical protein
MGMPNGEYSLLAATTALWLCSQEKERKKKERKCIHPKRKPTKVMWWNSWLLLLSHNP